MRRGDSDLLVRRTVFGVGAGLVVAALFCGPVFGMFASVMAPFAVAASIVSVKRDRRRFLEEKRGKAVRASASNRR